MEGHDGLQHTQEHCVADERIYMGRKRQDIADVWKCDNLHKRQAQRKIRHASRLPS